MQAFLLFGILDMRGKFPQLLLGAPDFEFAQLALSDIEHYAFPARGSAPGIVRRGTKPDPLDSIAGQYDAPLPIPEAQGSCRQFLRIQKGCNVLGVDETQAI